MGKPERRLGRVTVGAVTVVLTLLALQVTTAAPAAAASVSISPANGQAGSSATISGNAFLPVLTVELCWAGEGCSNLGAATADANGGFSAGVTIPSGAAPGRYTISACQVGTGCAQTGFTVIGNDTTTTTTTTTITTTTTGPTTTTSTTLGSTTTLRTTTTTLRQPTSDAPPPSSPTTTSPVPGTSQTPGFLPTTPGSSTTVPGDSADGTTGTTENAAMLADGGQPPDQSSPVTLDLKALTDSTTLDSIPESAAEPIVQSLGPIGTGSETEAGSPDLGFPDPGTDAGSPLDRFSGWGIWLGWLALIIGSFPVVLAVDNARRRKAG